MSDAILLLPIIIVVVIVYAIRLKQKLNRKIALAKHQAHIIEEEIRSKCCSKCRAL